MKNGKKPTRAQEALIKEKGWVPKNWLVVKDTPTELVIVSRASLEKDKKTFQTIKKG